METSVQEGTAGRIPSKGDRVELVERKLGVPLRGTVFYSDQIQLLVKLDSGRSRSLRLGIDQFRFCAAN